VDLEQKELMIRLAFLLIGSVGIALLAKRKNRNPWLWGAFGGVTAFLLPLLVVVPLLAVGFLKYRCPKCGNAVSNNDARLGRCPRCSPDVAAATG
jgi:rubrerythrin